MKSLLLEHYDRIKQAPGTVHGNLYALDLQAYQSRLGPLDQIWLAQRSLLVKKHEANFDRIEFYSKDLAELQAMIRQRRQRTEVMEWVGVTLDHEAVVARWEGLWRCQRQLLRMVAIASTEATDSGTTEFAGVADLPAMRAFFDTEFDPLAERIPSDEELLAHMQKREILLRREPSGALQGFVIRVQTGRTHHLKYLFVSPAHRGQRVGEWLFKQFIASAKPGERLILWVFHDNQAALQLYRKHGFHADGMVNFIFQSP